MNDEETILQEAQRLVMGDRQHDYGHPRGNYTVIAKLFNAYVDGMAVSDARTGDGLEFDAVDAAALMILMKVGRLATGGPKRDTLVDIAGYAEVAARTAGIDP